MKNYLRGIIILSCAFVLSLVVKSVYAASCDCGGLCRRTDGCNYVTVGSTDVYYCTTGTTCSTQGGTVNGSTCEYFALASYCSINPDGSCNINTNSLPGSCSYSTGGGGGSGVPTATPAPTQIPQTNGSCGSCSTCGAASSSECALINGVCSKAGYCSGSLPANTQGVQAYCQDGSGPRYPIAGLITDINQTRLSSPYDSGPSKNRTTNANGYAFFDDLDKLFWYTVMIRGIGYGGPTTYPLRSFYNAWTLPTGQSYGNLIRGGGGATIVDPPKCNNSQWTWTACGPGWGRQCGWYCKPDNGVKNPNDAARYEMEIPNYGSGQTNIVWRFSNCTPPQITNLSGSCSYNPISGTYTGQLSWTQPARATSYAIRVDNTANPWTGNCATASTNPGDFCATVADPAVTTYSFTGSAGTTYSAWVHGVENSSFGPLAGIIFSCPALGNLSVKTTLISGSNLCTNATSWTNLQGVTITSSSLTPNSQTTQVGTNPVTWSGAISGDQPATITAPSGYLLDTLCYERASNPGVFTEDTIHSNLNIYANDTTNYIAGFVPNVAWSQVSGGDLVSCGDINQQIPTTVDPLYKYLNLSGLGGYPGVVTYGTTGSFDIDPNPLNDGKYMASPLNWLVKSTPKRICDMDWYKYFGIQMDMLTPTGTTPNNPSALTKSDLFGGQSVVVKKLVNSTPNTTFTTSGDIVIDNGESLVLFVDGNLKFNGRLTRNGTGFAAFIVNGDITVDGTVGSSDTTPSLQGIFIAKGAFNTGRGTQITNERLNIKGTVVAKSINLQRSLDFTNNNITTPADKFFYDPELLFLMPDKMKDVKVNWKEVEP